MGAGGAVPPRMAGILISGSTCLMFHNVCRCHSQLFDDSHEAIRQKGAASCLLQILLRVEQLDMNKPSAMLAARERERENKKIYFVHSASIGI